MTSMKVMVMIMGRILTMMTRIYFFLYDDSKRIAKLSFVPGQFWFHVGTHRERRAGTAHQVSIHFHFDTKLRIVYLLHA